MTNAREDWVLIVYLRISRWRVYGESKDDVIYDTRTVPISPSTSSSLTTAPEPEEGAESR
jgi:hypothetical protein